MFIFDNSLGKALDTAQDAQDIRVGLACWNALVFFTEREQRAFVVVV